MKPSKNPETAYKQENGLKKSNWDPVFKKQKNNNSPTTLSDWPLPTALSDWLPPPPPPTTTTTTTTTTTPPCGWPCGRGPSSPSCRTRWPPPSRAGPAVGNSIFSYWIAFYRWIPSFVPRIPLGADPSRRRYPLGLFFFFKWASHFFFLSSQIWRWFHYFWLIGVIDFDIDL